MDSRKFLTKDERSHLEDHLKRSLENDLRNATMLLMSLYTGARASELLAIEWENIDIDSGEIYIKTLKKGRPRFVIVPKFIRAALMKLKDHGGTKPFPISYNRLGEIWREHRPCKKTLHSLRHTFAMNVYEKTGNIVFLQKSLGHKNMGNTGIYLDVDYTGSEWGKMMGIK